MKNEQLIEEIELFVKYAVPEDEFQTAAALVERYNLDKRILRLCREFYSTLPEAREEPITKISRLLDRKGVYLFVVTTTSYSYLYLVSDEHVLWVGEYQREVNTELLSFFGFESQQDFQKICLPVADLEEYDDKTLESQETCPACGVDEDEFHFLGCVVEECPWCGGQLSKCNCRFEQLDIDEITTEEQLEDFKDKLEAKGRVPYRKKQAPSYPGTSDGLDGRRVTN